MAPLFLTWLVFADRKLTRQPGPPVTNDDIHVEDLMGKEKNHIGQSYNNYVSQTKK